MFSWDYSAKSKNYLQTGFSPVLQVITDSSDIKPINTLTDDKKISGEAGYIQGLPAYIPSYGYTDNNQSSVLNPLYIYIGIGILIFLFAIRKKLNV